MYVSVARAAGQGGESPGLRLEHVLLASRDGAALGGSCSAAHKSCCTKHEAGILGRGCPQGG